MNHFLLVLQSDELERHILAETWYISTPLVIFINNPEEFDEEKVIAFQATDIRSITLVKEPQ